jgi:N-glycosylase/DNA lyase
MLSEMFSRLKVFGSLESYRYIGFGSIWFTDCVLFHRALGIEDIISIEKEQAHQARFNFNNPYRGIELRMGTAAEVLPGMDWTHRSIVWLDYVFHPG